MRLKKVKGNIYAVRLTEDNMEQVETICKGRIRGTSLPKKDRIVQFDPKQHQEMGENAIRIGDWLVEFRDAIGFHKIHQVWSNEAFHNIFEDIHNVTF